VGIEILCTLAFASRQCQRRTPRLE
jgi:hypothetical protein